MGRQREISTKEGNRSSLLCPEPMTQNDSSLGNSNEENNRLNRGKFSLFCGRTRVVQDGCWACISLIAAALVQFIVMGIHNSFGNMYEQILKEFNWKKTTSGIVII